jgi:hypothetical protein
MKTITQKTKPKGALAARTTRKKRSAAAAPPAFSIPKSGKWDLPLCKDFDIHDVEALMRAVDEITN